MDVALDRVLNEVAALDNEARLEARYDRFRRLGALGDAIIDTTPAPPAPAWSRNGSPSP